MEVNLVLTDNELVNRLVNKIMKNGEKRKAWKIVFKAAKLVEKSTSSSFVDILEKALENLMPKVIMEKRKAGAGSYRIPKVISPEKASKIALRWLVETLRERTKKPTQIEAQVKSKKWKRKPSSPMFEKLASEIKNVFDKTGKTYAKLENLKKESEAGKVFMR